VSYAAEAGSISQSPQTVRHEGENAAGTPDGSTQLDSNGDQYVIVGGAGPNIVGTLSQSLAPKQPTAEPSSGSEIHRRDRLGPRRRVAPSGRRSDDAIDVALQGCPRTSCRQGAARST
jgi:hypothetical protein